MKTKYPLGRQFGIWAKFTPSLSRGFLRLAAWAMPLLPKGLPRKKVRMARMDAGGVRAYLIEGRACGKDAPCLVYFHGGGFVFGGAPYHYRNAAAYALGAGCKVLFAEYPLAPAHPFPAPNAACLQVYRFACTHALGRAGVAVTLNETKGTMHGFDAASKSAAAEQASEARICALRRAFSEG